MPRRHRQFGSARDATEHRHADELAGLPEHLFVAGGADPVEESRHRCEFWCRTSKTRAAGPQCSYCVPLASTTTGRGRSAATRRGPSTRPLAPPSPGRCVRRTAHDPLDHRDVGARAAVPITGARCVVRTPARGRGCGRSSGCQRVIAGIDEVGPDLERRNPMPGASECAHQSRCDRGLSAARRGCGHYHRGRRGHHSITRGAPASGNCGWCSTFVNFGNDDEWASLWHGAIPSRSGCRAGGSVARNPSRRNARKACQRPGAAGKDTDSGCTADLMSSSSTVLSGASRDPASSGCAWVNI